MPPDAELSTPEVRIRIEGRAGRITLDRPKALNALTLGMVRAIRAALDAWSADQAVAAVVLDGAGERGLCAGGDVRSLYDARGEGSGFARTFWREEYELNALIHHYPKPFVALMDGIVMGGGIGLSAHAQGGTRIVTERSRIAFPETTIGLIPDVGGTWLLSRAPAPAGVYLALLGAQMNGADAIWTGFADRMVASARLPELVAALCSGANVTETLDRIAVTPGPAPLQEAMRGDFGAAFAAPSVVAVAAALERLGSKDGRVEKAIGDLGQRSPLALLATLEAVRRARAFDSLEQSLEMEFRLCSHLYEHGEFIEGVRALLVDKDRKPRWRPPTLAEAAADVAPLFEPVAGEAPIFSDRRSRQRR
jgi:enoyl-CoA hydratase